MPLHCRNQKAQLCQNARGCNTVEHFSLRQSLERQHSAQLLRKQRKSKRLTILWRRIFLHPFVVVSNFNSEKGGIQYQ